MIIEPDLLSYQQIENSLNCPPLGAIAAIGNQPGRIIIEPSFPIHPRHPERICWGCKRYCPAQDMVCGSEVERAQHPVELFGDDWFNSSDPECKELT